MIYRHQKTRERSNTHYRTWKKGKSWCYSFSVLAAIAGGSLLMSSPVHADTDTAVTTAGADATQTTDVALSGDLPAESQEISQESDNTSAPVPTVQPAAAPLNLPEDSNEAETETAVDTAEEPSASVPAAQSAAAPLSLPKDSNDAETEAAETPSNSEETAAASNDSGVETAENTQDSAPQAPEAEAAASSATAKPETFAAAAAGAISLADNGTGVFYTDSTENIRVITLYLNDVKKGDVVTVDLDDLELSENIVVNGATVQLSATKKNIIITFTSDYADSVAVKLNLKNDEFSSKQKSLSTIEAAIASGNVPGIQNITAKIQRADGTSDKAQLEIDAELLPYSHPIAMRDSGVFSDGGDHGVYVQGREYTFMPGGKSIPLGITYEDDDKKHTGFNSRGLAAFTIKDIPANFVLTGGIGWTQLADGSLSYDGTAGGNDAGSFTGYFSDDTGTYSLSETAWTETGYFAYSTEPVTVSGSSSGSIKIIAPTPKVPPTTTVNTKKEDEVHYNIDSSELLGGRELPNDNEASMHPVFNTQDPSLVDTGDNLLAEAHWNIAISEKLFAESFTIPDEAAKAVVTFSDGSTTEYLAGETAIFGASQTKHVTNIDIDFVDLPGGLEFDLTIPCHFIDASKSDTANYSSTISGTYSSGGSFNSTKEIPVRLFVHDGLQAGYAGMFGGSQSSPTVIKYGDENVKNYTPSFYNSTATDFTTEIYEPIIYSVLPLGVDYVGVTGGTPGYNVSTYTISTGQTVVKIDYTGSGKLINGLVKKSDFPTIQFKTKKYGVPITSTVYSYISAENDPTITNIGNIAIVSPPSDSLENEITQGNTNAYFGAGNVFLVNGAEYLIADSTITNNLDSTSKEASNNIKDGADHSFNFDFLNTLSQDQRKLTSLTNLPDSSEGLTLNFTRPGVLMDGTTGTVITDSSIGEILYSESVQILTDDGDLIDTTGYLTADQVTDWSKIKSFITIINEMNTNVAYRVEIPMTAPKAVDELDRPVTIKTNFQGINLHTTDQVTDTFTGTFQNVVYNVIDDTDEKNLETEVDFDNGLSNAALIKNQNDLQAIADGYLPKGYEIVSVDTIPGNFDDDESVDQVVNIHLRHATSSVEETEEVNETIHYVYASDNSTAAPDATDSVMVTRTATIDQVTKEITYTDWVAKDGDTTFDAVTSPTITNYTPDQASVPQVTGLDGDSEDLEVTVKYTANTEAVTGTEEVIRTIHYIYENGTPVGAAAPDKTETLTFERTGTKNLATGDITWNAWTGSSTSFPEVLSPDVKGYTPDRVSVPEVKGLDGDSADITETVVYTANPQRIIYNVIDDTDQKNLETEVYFDKGVTNGELNKTQDDLQEIADGYIPDGYEIVSVDTIPRSFDDDESVDQVVNIHLRHALSSVEETEKVNETIHYVYASDNSTAAPDATDSVTFTRTATTDQVTKEITYTDWAADGSDTTFDAVTSPTITNYTPDQASVAEVPGLTADSEDIEVTVKYTANTEEVTGTEEVIRTIHYIYEDGTPVGAAAPDSTETLTFKESSDRRHHMECLDRQQHKLP